jgi:hypothetical protein
MRQQDRTKKERHLPCAVDDVETGRGDVEQNFLPNGQPQLGPDSAQGQQQQDGYRSKQPLKDSADAAKPAHSFNIRMNATTKTGIMLVGKILVGDVIAATWLAS